MGLGQRCLAQSAPDTYVFSLDDIGPFRGQSLSSRPQFKLFERGGAWDLELLPEKKRIATLAFEDFRLSRYRTGELNRMLMVDWIFDFDPNDVLDRKVAKMVSPSKVNNRAFVDAWNAYRTRFAEELQALKDELKRLGYTKTAELYFSKDLVQKGLLSALQDPEVRTRLQTFAASVLTEKLSNYDVKVDEKFEVEFQGKPYETTVAGNLKVAPRFLIDQFRVDYEPSANPHSNLSEIEFGKITFTLPMTEAQLNVNHFEISSEFMPQPYRIQAADEMSMTLAFNREKPFKITGRILWDKLLQRPEIRLAPSDLQSPFKTAQLSNIKLRGEAYEPSQGSVTEWMLNQEGWRLIQNAVGQDAFVQTMMNISAQQLSKILAENLPFRETFVAIQNPDPKAEEKFSLEVFQAGLAAHDPGLNHNLVARFQLTIPIEIESPEMSLNVRPTADALAGKISIRILNPDVELEHLELFWRGQRLSSDRLGFRFRMINRTDRSTKLDAAAGLSVNKALKFKLDELKTNLEGLAIRALEVRLGSRWLTGNRPSVQMILDNIDWIRKELTSPAGQSGLGGKLQAFVENQMRKELTSHLRNLSIAIPADGDRLEREQEFSWYTDSLGGLGFIEKATLGLKATIDIPYIPLQGATFRLRDLKAEKPVCKGTYLASAEAKIALTDPIPVVGRNWNLAVEWRGLKTALTMGRVLASVIPQPNSKLQFVFDLCMAANRDNVDLQLRTVEHNLNQARIAGVQVMSVEASSDTLERLAKIFGWGAGVERDSKLSELAENLLRENSSLLASAVSKFQAPWFAEQIQKYLDSAPVRGQIERSMIELGDVEEQVIDLMWDLGKFLKAPLERMIVDNLNRIVGEQLPKVEKMVNDSRSKIDELIINIGSLAGEDLERVLQSELQGFVYGSQSSPYLYSELRRRLEPSGAVTKLKQSFGVRIDPMDEFRWFRTYGSLTAALPRCPFQNPDDAIHQWREALDLTKLSRAEKEDLEAFILTKCMPRENGAASKELVDELFREGLLSANQLLMDEGARHFLKLPAKEGVPLATGPDHWDLDRRQNKARDFEIPVEVSKVELLSQGSLDAFRIVFTSQVFSNELSMADGGVIQPFVFQSLNAGSDSLIFRLPREIINQVFLKIDWVDLLRQNFSTVFSPYDQIIVDRAPYLTAEGEILFKVYARSRSGKIRMLVTPIIKLLASLFQDKTSDEKLNRLVEKKNQDDELPGVNLGDVVAFGLSFLDLRNMFGFEANVDGAIRPHLRFESGKVSIAFEPMALKDVDAGFLKTPIERRLEVAHKPINRMISDLLSQVGEIPSLAIVANRFSLSDIQLVAGDLFVVIRREDLFR